MERDPLRFAWRAAPILHGIAFALILLALPLLWIAFDLVRTILDDAVAGRAFAAGPTAPFLRSAISLPERLAAGPVLLVPGVAMSRFGFAAASALALAALLVGGLVLAALLGRLRAGIAARGAARLRRAVLDGLLRSRPGAGEEARDAAVLFGETFNRQVGFVSDALLVPAASFAAVTLTLFYALAVDARLAAAVLVGILAVALAEPPRLAAAARDEGARRNEARALGGTFGDLARRLPALRAHGTASGERERLADLLGRRHAPLRATARRAAFAAALAVAARLLGPAGALGTGAWLGLDGETAGAVAAVVAAALVGGAAVAALARWQFRLDAVRPTFDALADALATLPTRRAGHEEVLPASGRLAAEGVAAFDPGSGARLAPLDLSVAFPAHLALLGDGDAGARVLAALLGGQLEPSSGRLSFGGVDLALVDPDARARRIAYAGGDTILVSGSLRDNLLYGCADAGSPDSERRLAEAVETVGLDAFVQRRGLDGRIDPSRRPDLAGAMVEARRAVRATLATRGLSDAIDPFDPDSYNRHATVGENILFGVPVGDAFREENLSAHPFLRAILEAEDLTKTLTAMGGAIAANMVEIFADIPDGHPLFQRFSFFSAAERPYFEHLVERPDGPRRGADAARDRDRLLGLSLRYGESRHRLGLLDDGLERRLLAARTSFAKLLPPPLQPAIEFYRPDRYLAAATVSDNLLFGRVSHDRAGADEAVRSVVRRVLTERGLEGALRQVGLDAPLDPEDVDLLPAEAAAIDLARCLVRRPDVLVVERVLDGLAGESADGLVERLRRALVGRGLVLVAPALTPRMDRPPFDVVARLERGGLAGVEDRRAARPAAPAAPAAGSGVAKAGTAA